eukprot:1775030-Prymnesium_polylepis.1
MLRPLWSRYTCCGLMVSLCWVMMSQRSSCQKNSAAASSILLECHVPVNMTRTLHCGNSRWQPRANALIPL